MIVFRTQRIPLLFSMRSARLYQGASLVVRNVHPRVVRLAIGGIGIVAFAVLLQVALLQVWVARMTGALIGVHLIAVGGILGTFSAALATLRQRAIGFLPAAFLLSPLFLVGGIGKLRSAGLLALDVALLCLSLSLCLIVVTIIASAGAGVLLQSALLGLVARVFFRLDFVGMRCTPLNLIGADTRLAPEGIAIRVRSALVKLVKGLFVAALGAALEVGYTIHVNLQSRLAAPRMLQASRGFLMPVLYHEMALQRITMR